MKRALAIIAVIGAGVAMMAARPDEAQLLQQLNGQPTRWLMPDGGASGVFTISDGGTANNTACMLLTGGTQPVTGTAVLPNVLVFTPLQPVNMCVRPSAFAPAWDGGCNVIPTDVNYGIALPAGVPQYVTPDSKATRLCFVGDAGSLTMPVFFAQ